MGWILAAERSHISKRKLIKEIRIPLGLNFLIFAMATWLFHHCSQGLCSIHTRAWNCRIVSFRRDFLRCSSPDPSSSRSSESRLPRAVSSWVLSVSADGGSTIPLGNLLQCWTTLTMALFATRVHFWLMMILMSTNSPRSFSAELQVSKAV